MRILYTCIFALLLGSVAAQTALELNVIGSYASGVFDDGAIEIAAYNAADQKVYAVNGATGEIDIFSIADPTNIELETSIDLSAYGSNANSVAFYNGVLVAAVEASNFNENGKAVFFNAAGDVLANVEVGVLPDMITFTPDGSKVITANEGEPDDDYTADPMGSVSVIDISGGVAELSQANVTTYDFTAFDSEIDPEIRIYGPKGSALSEDFETDTVGLNNFIVYSAASDRDWSLDDFGGDRFAEANGFGADEASDDWLISPAVDLSAYASASFSFVSAKNFDGGDFRVLISTDYSGAGDPTAANWTDITDQAALSEGGYNNVYSGQINISAMISATTSVAFHYTSTGTGAGDGALWQIDDIAITAPALLPSRNLEPEYVAVSADSRTAFVVCQENNALAVLDLENGNITALKSLGFKNHNLAGNGFDASNRIDDIEISTWPTYGMYMPDAITTIDVNGETYVLSANEGDSRDYDAYSEEERIKDLTLDQDSFPNATDLQLQENLGRLKITTANGDLDGDGDVDRIYSYGARSFSVWSATGDLVFDSGDQFAQVLATEYPDHFNSNNDDNDSKKSRSDDKGCEPEAITTAVINDRIFAFIGLERMGGVMVYEVSDPTAPQFISYYLNRNFAVDADNAEAGDLGPEGLVFVSAADSPNGSPLLITANEVSGTLSIYEVSGTIVSTEDDFARENILTVYPNPVADQINFNRATTGILYDMMGRPVMSINGQNVNVSKLPAGLYLYKAAETEQSLQILKQ